MKKIILGLLACVIGTQCFANSIDMLNDKFYVAPGSVYVAPDAIYINLNGNFISVDSIAVDSNGVYIPTYESRMISCLRCGKYHDDRKGCPKD